ncbi:mycothiol system anti-sigma-R factor [Nakamurella sp. PAMC28650]|jgi:mycothiol system anti-sigma-R factor|uniref:mycothiol system anti-sigma-R factor n=1 Tax=Nakamurella sp. PAMC28650 TaxID=2762325 RepID=UPI00164D9F28|nr:mycothiol system anti-sigma-R factor [Nakamurella sp. PAMC28650]QNK80816.1 mycothiol system anti-sigma-R factor [Nakamurella sp. PAMC28650]
MACGDPEDIECAGVLRDVWQFLDDELDPANRAAVEAHLDGCSPCLEEANLDQKLKALLHRKCGGDVAPEDLRAKVAARLRSVTVTSVSAHGYEQVSVRSVEF